MRRMNSSTRGSFRRGGSKRFAVYKATNKKTGASYTGRTGNVRARMNAHLADARGGSGTNFHKAIRRHGASSFSVRVVAKNLSDRAADRVERSQISKARRTGKSYNMQSGGKRGAAEWLRRRPR